MKLNFIPMLYDRGELSSAERILFGEVLRMLLADETLGRIFSHCEVHLPVTVPPPKVLNKRGIHNFIKSAISTERPYIDKLSGRYTTRFFEEAAKKAPFCSTTGKVLAMTDVELTFYNTFDISVAPRINGCRLGENTALVSTYGFDDDAFSVYKESKHELGHTLDLQQCGSAGCVMNSIEDFAKRGVSYCGGCNNSALEYARKNPE